MTLTTIDHTHDPDRRSWVPGSDPGGTDFPIQNLPFGAAAGHLRVAIGDWALDLHEAAELLNLSGTLREAIKAPTLNALLALGRPAWTELRHAVSALLEASNATLRDDAAQRARTLHAIEELDLAVPMAIGDYTDFYASIHHATNVGSMFRPDNPLMPNYKHLPVGYHGRASSIVASGTPIRRPRGQVVPAGAEAPVDAPCRLLDYELEMGFVIGPANAMGERVSMAAAPDHIFGLVLLNDWSARDVQKWEYQPLGPFNAKNFATTIAPWIVTLDALEPYRVETSPRGADDPPLLDYLAPAGPMAFDVTLEVALTSPGMRSAGERPWRVSRGSFTDMYWSIAQLVAHHTSTGCNLRAGDLLASGTISGPAPESRGCLLERTWRGEQPLSLPDGTERKFLLDGDEVTITGRCERPGAAPIGFGRCTGRVEPA